MSTALEKLSAFRGLKQNWDSYGAAPITEDAIHMGIEILTGAQVVPTNSGGVQIEWHCAGLDVEVEIGPTGEVIGAFWAKAR